ncbi:MAG TPA: efflux RND transporter periplasmic adaptor subunit, partial [Xenococcaceae cyanobacterium]
AELKAGARTETIAAAKATVRDLQEQLELAQTKSQRRENLFAQGAISREQLEENVTSKQAIQARLDEAQSQLDELLAGTRAEIIMAQESAIARVEARLEKLRVQEEKKVLKAPFAATVSEKLLDEGTVVTAERPILRLVEAKALEARIGVPVDNATKIPLGSEQKLEIAGEFYQGKVTALLPEVDNQTRTVTAVLTIEQPTVKVFPGQVAKLHLTTEIPHSGYWLPTTALVEGARGLWFAYALGEKAATAKDVFTVERREVEVLATQSDRVLVRGTIREGDRIISNGTHRIVNGQLVRESVISHQSSVISY